MGRNSPFPDRNITRTIKTALATEVEPARASLESIDESLQRTVEVNVSAALDCNDPGATTVALDVAGFSRVGIEIVGLTGTHGTHAIQVRARVAESGAMKAVANDPLATFLGGGADVRMVGTAQLLQLDVAGYSALEFRVVITEGAPSTVAVHARRWK